MWYIIGVIFPVVGTSLVAWAFAERRLRQRADRELRASVDEQRRLIGRLIESQEAERRRVARELHDDFGQRLALLTIEAEVLARRPRLSDSEMAKRLQGLSAQVKELSSAIHDLSHRLHPSKVEELGLVAAMRGLCNELGRYHALTVNFTHRDVPRRLPPAEALCLYRVSQEALRNVVRHSGTDRAAVELIGRPAAVRLIVTDAGVGFDPSAAGSNDGLGLVSMRERVQLSGGELTIDARPSGGTRIDVQIPALWPVTDSNELETDDLDRLRQRVSCLQLHEPDPVEYRADSEAVLMGQCS